jgi:DNA-binding beta-propeller fold protein YncE
LATVVAVSSLVLPAAALAGTGHKYAGALGSPGGSLAAGDFSGPQGIATDSSTGDLFVADVWNNRIQSVSASGDTVAAWDGSQTPAAFFNGIFDVAVDAANDRVYVTEQYNDVVDVFDQSGAYVDQLTAPDPFVLPAGVAVDASSGDVFVVDQGAGAVDVFNSTGTFVRSFGSPGAGDGELNAPTDVAVDPTSHDVYVLDAGNSRVERFTSTGTFVSTLAGTQNPAAVAVDPANQDVYVGENAPAGWQIARYDSSGGRLEEFGSGHLGGIGGLSTSPTSHRVYATDPVNAVVAIFAPVKLPDVTTGAASGVTATAATLTGTVNTQGLAVWNVWLEYGIDTTYGNRADDFTDGFPASTTDAPATVAVSALQPNKTYHYRLAAASYNGTSHGADQTFTTDPAAPIVDHTSAAPVSPTAATLHAQVNANNSATTYHFEYGTTNAYGSSTPDASAGSGNGDVDAPADVTGLQPDTTYHFRVVTDNGTGGPVTSPDMAFKTAPGDQPTATGVTGSSATLQGVADLGISGTYHFEYGTDTSYGTSTPEASAPQVAGDQTVTAPVNRLAPATTYHFRLVSSVDGNTTVTRDGTFTTVSPATVTAGAASDVGSGSAALHGTVDSHGQSATYRFVVTGLDSTVRRSTPDQTITSTSPIAVTSAISDLPEDSAYRVVLSATVGGVESRSDATTFTTAKLPAVTLRSPVEDTDRYGCAAPHLDQPSRHAASGKAYTLTGRDLGGGGDVSIDGNQRLADTWSAGAITFTVPDDAHGRLSVSIDCGAASNTVTLEIPDNAFSIVSAKTRGSRATVTVTVPGPGVLGAQGTNLRRAHKTASKAGRATLTLTLTGAGQRALRRGGTGALRRTVSVLYTPVGGTSATRTRTLTFHRRGHS